MVVDGKIKTKLYYPITLHTDHKFFINIPESNLAEMYKSCRLPSLKIVVKKITTTMCSFCLSTKKLNLKLVSSNDNIINVKRYP